MSATNVDEMETSAARSTLPHWNFLDGLPAALGAGGDRIGAFRQALADGSASLRQRFEEDEPIEARVRDAQRAGKFDNNPKANVRDIVRRAPLYAGYVVYHDVAHKQARWTGMLYPGQHEALIDWETTLAVLAVTGRTLQWTFGPTRP